VAPARTPLSAGTSEQVRVILEAAERSAGELREDAGREAAAHVARVGEAADGMLSRLDDLHGELERLMSALRESGQRLSGGLASLQQQVASVGPLEAAPEPDAGEPPVAEEDFAAAAEPGPEPAPAPRPDLPNDEAGARIIALNMALGGSPREETAAYLAEHFALDDPDGLLDDVYSKVGG
jgi:hypothetical protein